MHTEKSDEAQESLVEDIMSKLGLAHVASQLVGSPSGVRGESRGISGGERKRLAVAEVMINKPQILFLDEYTRYYRGSALPLWPLIVIFSNLGSLLLPFLAHACLCPLLCPTQRPGQRVCACDDKAAAQPG